ncbi:helicase-related protein [Acidithiobacillus sp. M4-SHS-6]|uniref:helicase-related protein n=1 Tax=Acidithiobacillus sp. M4-SHS-6 TaxID=3383024 RepID=UPI0039BE438E
MMKLRQYQEQAVEALLKDAYDGLCPVGVLPTGAGKTVIMRAIIEQWLKDHPDHQILLLAHRTRLLTQAKEKFDGIPTLVVSAGMGQWDEAVPGSITVASIQTVSRLENRRDWDLVLVDETHRVGLPARYGLPARTGESASDGEGQYAAYLGSLDKDPPIIGLTATPWRMSDNGRHVPIYGPQSLFQKVSCWITPEELIAQGYLVAPEVVPVQHVLPATGIQLSHGEVAIAGIEGYRSLDFTQRIQEVLEKTRDCHHVLIFCDSIKEAEAVAEALAEAEAATHHPAMETVPDDEEDAQVCVLHGGHSETERNAQIERFRQGAFRFLVNVDVFTEGLDVPEIDAVVLLRRTQSVVRYLQMAGRGLRPDNGHKNTCRILDFGQHIERLGPIEAARGENALPLAWKKRRWKKRGAEENPLSKQMQEQDGLSCPDGIEPEAPLCVLPKAWRALPIRARNGTHFLLLRFRIDDLDPSSNKTLWVERKLHASDPSLREMARRWSRLSGISLHSKQPLPVQMQCMSESGQGFLDYAPFAIRVRWSERAERWMVDGWQWSGRKHMKMDVGEEQALNAWIQRTTGTQDAVEQTMRQFLYRLSRSGVLDLKAALPGAEITHAESLAPVSTQRFEQAVSEVPNPVSTVPPPPGWETPSYPPVMPSPPLQDATPLPGASPLQGASSLSSTGPTTAASLPSVGLPSAGHGELTTFPPSRPPAWLAAEMASSSAESVTADGPDSASPVSDRYENVPTAVSLKDFQGVM